MKVPYFDACAAVFPFSPCCAAADPPDAAGAAAAVAVAAVAALDLYEAAVGEVAEAVALLYMRMASWSTGSAVSRLPEEAERSEAAVEESAVEVVESEEAPRLDLRVPRSARSWLPLEESRALESRLAMPGIALLSRLTWLIAALMKDSTVGKFPPAKTAPRESAGGLDMEASGDAVAPGDAAPVVLLSAAVLSRPGLVES